ncbi:MAG: NYN domain-containing protein [Sulfurimonadaceae bacterium]
MKILFNIFRFERRFFHVNKKVIDRLTWGRGSLKPKTLLLWDLENVPFAYFGAIKKKLPYAPEKAFIITKQNLRKKTLRFMEQNGFEIFTKHKTDSDTKIKNITAVLNLYEEFVIVSSDADFIPMGKKILAQNKKLTWIMRDIHKKRVLMKINLTSPTLRLVTLSKEIPL